MVKKIYDSPDCIVIFSFLCDIITESTEVGEKWQWGEVDE